MRSGRHVACIVPTCCLCHPSLGYACKGPRVSAPPRKRPTKAWPDAHEAPLPTLLLRNEPREQTCNAQVAKETTILHKLRQGEPCRQPL